MCSPVSPVPLYICEFIILHMRVVLDLHCILPADWHGAFDNSTNVILILEVVEDVGGISTDVNVGIDDCDLVVTFSKTIKRIFFFEDW